MEPNTSTPSSQKLAAALAAARVASAPVQVAVAQEAGHSLADMAQRDLDAALQLLADRAQYITGASGAAIALRRDGKKDMLCRASAGSNAPELGALLSTEFGLSGESVRTRQLLRCDDAERDARVNREVCRQLGIASVVVMPVVHDDQVLGVFELFSGKANAFAERDLSAVQRLSEMVETAVRLAQTSETLPPPSKDADIPAASEIRQAQFVSDLIVDEHAGTPAILPSQQAAEIVEAAEDAAPVHLPETEIVAQAATAPAVAAPQDLPPEKPPVEATPAKKPLFWSAALHSDAEAAQPAEADQSHVPPMLRGLRKCEVCGFPVSAGRVLCVECEEKKWRGQLRISRAVAKAAANPVSPSPLKTASPAYAAAAPSMAKNPATAPTVPASVPSAPSPVKVGPSATPTLRPSTEAKPATDSKPAAELKPATASKKETGTATGANASITAAATYLETPSPKVEASAPELVFSAGLAPSQSWLSRNKYVLGALLAIAGGAAAVFLFR